MSEQSVREKLAAKPIIRDIAHPHFKEFYIRKCEQNYDAELRQENITPVLAYLGTTQGWSEEEKMKYNFTMKNNRYGDIDFYLRMDHGLHIVIRVDGLEISSRGGEINISYKYYSYDFRRYMERKDFNWPQIFPMIDGLMALK
jgi:hypothetical protein